MFSLISSGSIDFPKLPSKPKEKERPFVELVFNDAIKEIQFDEVPQHKFNLAHV